MNCGAPSVIGTSSPAKRTRAAPGATPALASTSRRRTPVQRAQPIAPLPHWVPVTRGSDRPRPLPAHWLIATTSTVAPALAMSSSASETGALTAPPIATRCAAALIAVGIDQFQRTKNRSLGVITPSRNAAIGVSSKGGRMRWMIISPLPGKAGSSGRRLGPPGRPRSISFCASTGAASAAPSPPAPAPAISARRVSLLSLMRRPPPAVRSRCRSGQPQDHARRADRRYRRSAPSRRHRA